MESSSTPPGKRTSFPSPLMVLIIAGIIIAVIVLFLVLRPNPRDSSSKFVAPPPPGISSTRNKVEKGVLLLDHEKVTVS
jgi:hypothetical protein